MSLSALNSFSDGHQSVFDSDLSSFLLFDFLFFSVSNQTDVSFAIRLRFKCGVEFFGELDKIGIGYFPLVLDNKFKAGAGTEKIKMFSSRKLKFGSGTISVFTPVGEIYDSSMAEGVD